MKRIITSFLTAALLCALLLTALPLAVAADEPLTVDQITATDMNNPINPNASRESKNLLAYLQTLSNTNRFVTGTFDYNNDSSVYNGIKEQFGTEVGLFSCRYYVAADDGTQSGGKFYNFLDFYNVDSANRELKKHYDNGNILLVHADGAMFGGAMMRYAREHSLLADGSSDDLIVHLDSTNPDRDLWMYQSWVTYQERVVESLQKLEDMGVNAYLYRAWVEYNYGGQYGRSDEGKAAMRRVWQQTSEYMCRSGLKGFLMTYSPGGDVDETMEARYPGNTYVDVLSVTYYSYFNYSTPGQGGSLNPKSFKDYSWYVRTGKPIGFSETSCRTGDWTVAYSIGRQSWYNTLTSMITYWPRVSFVNCWANGHYSLLDNTGGDTLEGNDDGYLYVNSPYSINLDELPDYRTGVINAPGVVQVYAQKDYGGNKAGTFYSNYTGLEEKTYTYSELQALGLNPASLASLHLNDGYGLLGFTNDTATGDPTVAYTLSKPAVTANNLRSLRVTRLQTISADGEVTASSNDDDAWKVNDGELSRWSGEAGADGTGWLVLTLEKPVCVSRWLVRHAGAAGDPAAYNTADFLLQYRTDGQTWQTADTVTGNHEGVTERTLQAEITARYFRLYITKANSTVAATEVGKLNIVEWELYGLPVAATAVIDPEPDEDNGDNPAEDIPGDDDTIDTPDGDDTSDSADDGNDTPTPSKRRRVTRTVTTALLPWWAWVLIGVAAVAVIGTVVLLLVRRKKQARQTDNT